jgi:hypothetical protein
VNKADSKYDFNQMRGTIQTTYNIPVAGILPLSSTLSDYGYEDLFSLHYPDHDWSKRLCKVVEVILSVLNYR